MIMEKKNLLFQKKKLINLFNQKKFSKICKISSKTLNLFIDQKEIVKIIVISYLNQKNYFKAEQFLKKALFNETSSELFYFLGNVLKIQEKNTEAIEAYFNSIELNSNFSEAYNNLANVQKKIGKTEDALANYQNAIKNKKDNFEAFHNLANLQRSLKNYDEAIKNYKILTKLKPDFVEVYNNIGAIYSITGNFKEAKKYYIKCIELNEFFPEAYKNYVQLSKIKKNDIVFKKLLSVIKEDHISDDSKEVFYYSLSKIYFDLENTDLAFEFLDRANNLKLNKIKYSIKIEQKEFASIKEFFSQKELLNIHDFETKNLKPIFIVGMPRSGTTLIEQIISNHSEVFGCGELDFLPISVHNSNWSTSEDFEKVIRQIRDEYLKKILKLSDKTYFTDKLPGNFKRIGFILNSFPEAKIIHLRRNPMAICWSNYKSNFNNIGMGFTLSKQYVAEYYTLYEDLMTFWKSKYPDKIIDLDYEKLVENFKEEVKNLFSKLELKWEKQLYDFHKNERPVETASFKQVRNKIFKQSSEKWKIYKKYLKPMTEILDSKNIAY